ncbi:MAG: efflux RND transporter periplasmic adaptor subunit [Longimicrobiales bacterium]
MRIRLLALSTAILVACGGDPEPAEAPAHIENPVTEADLTTVRLSSDAVSRLGIVLGEVESKSVQGQHALGGELMAAPGRAVTITAPRAATVLSPAEGSLPIAGAVVSAGQPLLRLAILPGDVARGGEEVEVAEARRDNARAKAERAERLLTAGVGSPAQAEDARAELRSAEAVLAAARARLDVQHGGEAASGMSAVVLRAPHAGIVQSVSVAVGQAVADGAALLEVVDPDPLWVRVPVYVGDLENVDRTQPAILAEPGGEGEGGRAIQPVRGPATADPLAASADLFYRLPNAQRRYRPGQRVSVSVPLRAEATESVVPWSAILYDIYGGAWVYESLGDNVFTRRRVEVRSVTGGTAVLARGPAPGTSIVVVGAAELFSTEFGTSH